MSVMISLRDVRLSNTSGHCVLVKAQIPTTIPPQLREDAIIAGMIDHVEAEEVAGPTPVAAPTPAPVAVAAPVAAEPVPTPPETVEAPTQVEDTGVDDAEALSSAIRKLLVRDDPADFKNDGTPKVVKVVSEMPPECKRPTATQVFAAYEKLQDDPDLAIMD